MRNYSPIVRPAVELPDWVAHTPSVENPKWHGLVDHLKSVSRLAGSFALPFGAEEIAAALGRLHDLGKFSDSFQQYLLDCHRGIRRQPGSAPHKQHGAMVLLDQMGELGQYLAPLVFGHHGGIPSVGALKNELMRSGVPVAEVASVQQRANSAGCGNGPLHGFNLPPLGSHEQAQLYFRFLFSALVDADALDTEAHFQPAAAAGRIAPEWDPASLLKTLMTDSLRFAGGPHSAVNEVRRDVLESCIDAGAQNSPGFFNLTVPTGGGKTRSSLAFALSHAAVHGLRRVVYAIPFTSIVDQTAEAFRSLFPRMPGLVLEHHSAVAAPERFGLGSEDRVDPSDRWRLLASENWDAPIVVTTTVQLFESLFSNQPGACRKLHRLAGSVLVLDEVQTIPSNLLQPILLTLRSLVETFGATVVLCTATQPSFEQGTRYWSGIGPTVPIVPEEKRRAHFDRLRRVRYRVETESLDWVDVAARMRENGSALCVVNARADALALMDALDPEDDDDAVFHLSTLMCGHHRRQVLATVRDRLARGLPTLLASTQVVEAGVDIDFPAVFRAMGPLDRIIQSAGRCNREGLRPLEDSLVTVFEPRSGGTPAGTYAMAVDRTRRFLTRHVDSEGFAQVDDPTLVTAWFQDLYEAIRDNTYDIRVAAAVKTWDYPEVSRAFRMIAEDTESVFVANYQGAPDSVAEVLAAVKRNGALSRDLWRRIQPYSVNVHKRLLPDFSEPVSGFRVWEGSYDRKRGFPLTIDPYDTTRSLSLIV
jgi:CRISPR-associated endonuclease/helicase Cas3